MENRFIMLCHPRDRDYLLDNKVEILKKVFNDEGTVAVAVDASFAEGIVHTFINGEYCSFFSITDEEAPPIDESKLPTNYN